MADVATQTRNKPAWVDLATKDADAARSFYAKVFGWQIEVNPDPQYGGYDVHFCVEYLAHHEAHHIYQMLQRRSPLLPTRLARRRSCAAAPDRCRNA